MAQSYAPIGTEWTYRALVRLVWLHQALKPRAVRACVGEGVVIQGLGWEQALTFHVVRRKPASNRLFEAW